jgi:nicotinamide-nucleotide amidase
MKAEIVSIGTELLLGEIVDTNAQFLAGQLASLGIDLYYVSTVGDNVARLAHALEQAWNRSDVVLTTGGLGPTPGDVTREAISHFLGEKLELDAGLKADLVGWFARRQVDMPESNLKQAMRIPSAKGVSNPVGTAPGWWVERDGRILVAMPGPPAEMRFMWQNEVASRLSHKSGSIISSRIIKTFGVSEAKLVELLAPFINSTNPTLATYAKSDGIHLRVTSKANSAETAMKLNSEREAEITGVLGDAVWGYDVDTQEDVVGRLLVGKSLTLAVAESFTGGLLTQTLSGANDNARFLKGGVVVLSDDSRVALGLDRAALSGHPSVESARAMAAAVRRRLGANLGISLEGSSASGEATENVRIFVAISGEQDVDLKAQTYSWRLHQMRTRAVYYSLFDLICLLRSMR